MVGLHDDEIAGLWRASIPYSHYDGVVTTWNYPGADAASALARLRRLQGRPQFILHEDSMAQRMNLNATRQYIDATGLQGQFTFRTTGFRNHNDAWLLRPSPARTALRAWLSKLSK